MRYLDQRHRPLPNRLSEQICDAVLGDHVVHVGPRDPHPIAGLEQRLDPRGAIVGGGRQADDRLAAGGSRRAPDEGRLCGYAAIELTFELVDADLARQVDREGLGDRYHARIGGDLLRIADLIDRQEQKMGIVVDEVVEPPRAQAIAGDDAAVVARLAATGHHAGLDELYDPVGYDVAVDADVATVPEMRQRRVGDASEPDL